VPFIVSQTNGRWGTPVPIPGMKQLNRAGIAVITSLSCTSRGCAAGGFTSGIGNGASTSVDNVPQLAFLVTETGGRWNHVVRVPGLAALPVFGSNIDLITCEPTSAPVLRCAAIGDYQTHSGTKFRIQAFVAVHSGTSS
jgi:hypothetical protein